jgi:transposase-like protein
MHLTEFAKALDKILDGGLVPFVQTRAADGQSWRRISLDLRDATGIRVTHETLRGWAAEWARDAEYARLRGVATRDDAA